ncbi:adenylosuccinate synthetase [Candidatus Babeliales bacterium]|nr:adenylosuccinate synthetase [Candidatus Babeliales bacterium]
MKKKILSLILLNALINLCAIVPRTVLVIGDEDAGKGKVTYTVGAGARIIACGQGEKREKGHKVCKGVEEYNLNLIPVGIVRNRDIECYLMAGMEIDPSVLVSEINYLKKKGKNVEGRLFISSKAHVVMPYHKKLDALMAEKYKGSPDAGACKGTGAAAADKRLKMGIRIADLMDSDHFKVVLQEQLTYANEKIKKLFTIPKDKREKPFDFKEIYDLYSEYARRLKPFVKENLEYDLNKKIVQGVAVVFEGAQGVNLDVSLGSYPYVSSSSTTASGVCTGLGIGPSRIGWTVLVVPAYVTCHSAGPLPTEIKDESIVKLLQAAHSKSCPNYSQRYGWIDLVQVRHTVMINGVDSLVITKLDDLDDMDEIKLCYDYLIGTKHYDAMPTLISEAKKIKPHFITMPGWKTSIKNITKFSDLPENARAFIKKIEILTGTPISYISVGPDRKQMIMLNDLLPL